MLQDCANIVPTVGAIGTLIVGIAALAVSIGALVTQCQALQAQREALPVSVAFGLTGEAMWMKVTVFAGWRLGYRTQA